MCYEASLGDSRGRADGSVSLFCGERTPPRHSMNGPLPQGGVRYSATLVADPLAKQSLALSPFQGACGGLREFIQGFEGRTPLAILRMALTPLSGGVHYCA